MVLCVLTHLVVSPFGQQDGCSDVSRANPVRESQYTEPVRTRAVVLRLAKD